MARRKDFFDAEQERIEIQMAQCDVRSDEYKQLQGQLKDIITIRGESRESRRRISKTDKGQLLIRGLTLTGALAAILGIAKFEKDGNTFTGEKRSLIDTVGSCIGRFLFK